MYAGCTNSKFSSVTMGFQALASGFTQSMFSGCTNLKSGTTYVLGGIGKTALRTVDQPSAFAYYYEGCTNLQQIYFYGTFNQSSSWPSPLPTLNWVSGVPSTEISSGVKRKMYVVSNMYAPAWSNYWSPVDSGAGTSSHPVGWEVYNAESPTTKLYPSS